MPRRKKVSVSFGRQAPPANLHKRGGSRALRKNSKLGVKAVSLQRLEEILGSKKLCGE